MSIGENIKQIRLSLNKRQLEIVDELNNIGSDKDTKWTNSAYSLLEKGRRSLRMEEAIVMCGCLGVTLNDIAYGKYDKPQNDSQKLKEVAYYLEGIKAGRGDILPLGESHLQNIYKTIELINTLKL